MITENRYICEICGTEYSTEEGAQSCEESHAPIIEIDSMEFDAHKRMPKKVVLIDTEKGIKKTYIER